MRQMQYNETQKRKRLKIMFESLKLFIIKCLSARVKGKIIISLDGSGKSDGVKYGIELTHETKLDADLIPWHQ